MKEVQSELFSSDRYYRHLERYFPETSSMNGVDRENKYFIKALNLRLSELQKEGKQIISVGFVHGAYASMAALITFQFNRTEGEQK